MFGLPICCAACPPRAQHTTPAAFTACGERPATQNVAAGGAEVVYTVGWTGVSGETQQQLSANLAALPDLQPTVCASPQGAPVCEQFDIISIEVVSIPL